NPTARAIRRSREAGLATLRSTALTAPPWRSVTEFNKLILIICLHSSHGQSDCDSHFGHYFAQIIRIEFAFVNFDIAERIENLDRQFEPRRKFFGQTGEL